MKQRKAIPPNPDAALPSVPPSGPTALRSFDWEEILELPRDVTERVALRMKVGDDLARQFQDWLQGQSQHPRDAESLVKLFDEFVIYKAREAGIRVLLSDTVLDTVLHWFVGGEDEYGNRGPIQAGVYNLKRFAEALVQSTEQRNGDAWQKIDFKRIKVYKEQVVAEFLELQRQCKKASISGRDAWAIIESTVLAKPQAYSRLHQNLTSLHGFCREQPDACYAFVRGKLTPAPFFYQWYGWSTNRDPEKARQMISKGRK